MRNIPEDNLAMSVLLTLNNGGLGSGFLLAFNNKLYLITAKHVLFNENGILRGTELDLLCQSKDIDDDSISKYKINLSIITKLVHPTADVC